MGRKCFWFKVGSFPVVWGLSAQDSTFLPDKFSRPLQVSVLFFLVGHFLQIVHRFLSRLVLIVFLIWCSSF